MAPESKAWKLCPGLPGSDLRPVVLLACSPVSSQDLAHSKKGPEFLLALLADLEVPGPAPQP